MDDRPTTNAAAKDDGLPIVIDLLTDQFSLIQDEAEWLIDLLGPDLARCLNDNS
jgi:hypothetical protein